MDLKPSEDILQSEKNELQNLLDGGVAFKVGKRTFLIKQPYLGTLDILSGLYIKMEIDQPQLESNSIPELNAITKVAAKVMAQVVSVAVLNGKWKILLFSRLLASFFYWRLTPAKLLDLVQIILQMRNVTDFITSIRLTSGARTTKPNLIEQSKEV